jgi:hypothetical protein
MLVSGNSKSVFFAYFWSRDNKDEWYERHMKNVCMYVYVCVYACMRVCIHA